MPIVAALSVHFGVVESACGVAAFLAALWGIVSSWSAGPWCGVQPGEVERGLDVRATRLKHKEPGLIPLSGVAPLCQGLVSGLSLSCPALCSLSLSVAVGYKDILLGLLLSLITSIYSA